MINKFKLELRIHRKNFAHVHLRNQSINRAGWDEVLTHIDSDKYLHLARCSIAPSCDHLHLMLGSGTKTIVCSTYGQC